VNKQTSKRITNAALCSVLGAAVALPFTAFAQSSDGGFLMTLRLAERLISRDTSGPETTTTNGTTNQAISDVALSISSETRTQALHFDVGGGYRFVDSPATDGFEGEFTAPNIRLSYSQEAAASSITVTAFASRTDLDNATTLDTALATNGSLDPDFAELTSDGGTRDRLSFNARLTLRDDAPFGLNFAVKVDDYRYSGLPDTSTLTDFRYAQISAGARFDITPVMQANLGLSYGKTDNSGSDDVGSYGIDAGLILTQPNGQITVDLAATEADGDGQLHLSAGRSYTLEHTTATFGLGVSRATTDENFVTATASLKHTFADESRFGTFSAAANRTLTRAGQSDEDLVTSLSVGTNYALTPLAKVSLSGTFARSEDVLSGDQVDLSQATLSVGYDLTPDWTATAAVSAQSRDPSDAGATDSTSLSLGLSRTFDLRR
jgi:hypothetical protein